MLTTLVRHARPSIASTRNASSAALRTVVQPPAEPGRRGRDLSARQAATLAAFALGAGAIGSAVTADAGVIAGVISASVASAWVLARYPVMFVIYRPTGVPESSHLTVSWAMGTLPYLFALTPPLRFLAWLIGAALSYRTLAAVGCRRRAARAVAAGFGVEAAGFAILIAYRNIDVLLRLVAEG
ncbi:MAG: hypothetical protein U1E29_04275 [Coriobacteriia bacterium]|nr:hypothetical protein [Coriobacteriia bacterium]